MSYNVYVAAYAGASRDHHTIFVENRKRGAGTIFQVKGSIQQGMEFESKKVKKPEDSLSFVDKTLVGTVTKENYPKIATICATIPPPHKQFIGAKRINPKVPFRTCQEWNADALKALKNLKLLLKNSGLVNVFCYLVRHC
ncbi:hypothetical protein GLAREA_03013 [Glarea lozoyensis ATCC 20868]|uniref:Uncharacterized protein n=1 Tax=Glarea lozoyensis (strain ATCC 20868 / MF5171) TaxID=1116229 RepID=S3CPN1_GLAL2|nr:uncharacterized protein GLAREA_03013 [Glarea lozoyensis ATCC 20868]EPE27099.1 hypothetical protein GLAREA_03013 [Glarea lozoyensis ATCC 20868]